MRVLIIEDESAAAKRLHKMVTKLVPEAEMLEVIDTVEDAIAFFKEETPPDLVFSDIHLADGSSFEIFEEVEVNSPVIFTTAYDEHALEAFRVNSVDYLLKPIKEEDLQRAWDKFLKLKQSGNPPQLDIDSLLQALPAGRKDFQKRIVIRYGQHIKAVEIAQAAYFFIESKVTLMRTHEGKDYPVDFNLDKLEEILDPAQFFRINRKCIVNVDAIDQMYSYSKSRVRILLKPSFNEDAIVSSERSSRFKKWLAG
ncbi:MAG: LytTR family DNA-binding domain-containing protein [Bacteroidota bacterium]